MRYLSRIIKSQKVLIGSTVAVESDLPKIIKKSKSVENQNLFSEDLSEKRDEPINTLLEEQSVNVENTGNTGNTGNTENVEVTITEEQENALNKYIEEQKEKILSEYIEEARKKSELFFEEEMNKAYDEGMKRAEQDSQRIIEEANKRADEMVLEAAEIKKKAIEEYKTGVTDLEPELVALSLDIAQKILNKEIKSDSEYIQEIVKDAMDKVSSKRDVILKVSEKDYAVISKNMDKMLAKIEGFGEVNIVKEASLIDGSCIVETEYGTIDGGLKTRKEQIEKEILKMLNR